MHRNPALQSVQPHALQQRPDHEHLTLRAGFPRLLPAAEPGGTLEQPESARGEHVQQERDPGPRRLQRQREGAAVLSLHVRKEQLGERQCGSHDGELLTDDRFERGHRLHAHHHSAANQRSAPGIQQALHKSAELLLCKRAERCGHGAGHPGLHRGHDQRQPGYPHGADLKLHGSGRRGHKLVSGRPRPAWLRPDQLQLEQAQSHGRRGYSPDDDRARRAKSEPRSVQLQRNLHGQCRRRLPDRCDLPDHDPRYPGKGLRGRVSRWILRSGQLAGDAEADCPLRLPLRTAHGSVQPQRLRAHPEPKLHGADPDEQRHDRRDVCPNAWLQVHRTKPQPVLSTARIGLPRDRQNRRAGRRRHLLQPQPPKFVYPGHRKLPVGRIGRLHGQSRHVHNPRHCQPDPCESNGGHRRQRLPNGRNSGHVCL